VSIHIFGVRHHGPGCARSLRDTLEKLQPDIVLVEGPPDAQGVIHLLAHKDMRPPVALLIYAPDHPKRAVYYPFTSFSPEWQALRYTLAHDIPARFMDLPQAIQLAKMPIEEMSAAVESIQTPNDDSLVINSIMTFNNRTGSAVGADVSCPPPLYRPLRNFPTSPYQFVKPHKTMHSAQALPGSPELVEVVEEVTTASNPPETSIVDDPLGMLAHAAGYSDYELWWEQQIEQRMDTTNLFEGILEAMTALRSSTTPRNEEEAQREAHMRQTIRIAQKEGFQRIAVICGAWHSPVLSDLSNTKADVALLSGLKKIKVDATWIPWTNSRLSYRSGYGAGVTSPGWYEHLWTALDKISIRWLSLAAQLLREQGIDTSSASVIEAVRLADSLTALRDLPMPGIAELHEAIETVLCNGNPAPMAIIREKLEIGEKLGEVPPETPAVPLQRDLQAKQRRLLLKPSAEIATRDLDLRNETDRARSQLLHQLRLLGIEWGKLQRVSGAKKGSFHEIWQLQWQVEFAVSLIEANIWGNTLETAATSFVCHHADTIQELPGLTELLDKTILAELPGAIDFLLASVQKRAAVSADVRHLMDALPPLARVARYGNVRQTRAEQILPVIGGLFERVVVGLPGACASLDDDAAQQMVESIDNVQESLNILQLPNRSDQQEEWQAVLHQLIDCDSIHGLVRGRSCRLLLEQKIIDEEELQRLARLALSPVTPASQAAAWVEGILRGSGLQLLHQDGLWLALDHWLSDLAEDDFVTLLPLLRRAFSGFHAPERQKMGEKVRHLHSKPQAGARITGQQSRLNQERADLVLPILAHILGVEF
jgi:hypothetical protein